MENVRNLSTAPPSSGIIIASRPVGVLRCRYTGGDRCDPLFPVLAVPHEWLAVKERAAGLKRSPNILPYCLTPLFP